METIITNIIDWERKRIDKRRRFFKKSTSEIASKNLRLLKAVSIITFFLIIFFILFTPVLMPEWTATIQYYLFPVGVLIFAAFGFIYGRKEKPDYNIVMLACILFCITLIGFVCAIDIFPYKDYPSSFFPLILMVLPVIFIIRFRYIFPLIGLSEFVYVILVNGFKSSTTAGNDIFESIVAMMFSYALAIIIMRLRVEDNTDKVKYKHLSRIDSLTSIYNKGACEDKARKYFETRTAVEKCALLVIDVDNFKRINDNIGHAAGDKLLEEIGELLTESFRKDDIIGRIGGDEFLAVMKSVGDLSIVDKKCRLIQKKVAEINFNGKIKIGCSIGAVTLEGKNLSYNSIFQMADDALYESKLFAKGRFIVHNVDNRLTDNDNILLIADNIDNEFSILNPAFSDEYKVIRADSCDHVINTLTQFKNSIKLLLIDFDMDSMSGEKVLQYMKSRAAYNNIPTIVICNDEQQVQFVQSLGVMDTLIRPINSEDAINRICKMI